MRRFALILFLSLFCFCIKAEENSIPILERQVTISVSNETVQYILTEISHQAGFVFSYSPEVVNSSTKTSLKVENQSVRFVLNLLFEENIKYKVRGKYVILQKNTLAQQNDSKKEVVVEGYLYDSQTGEKLTEATVYSKEQKVAATTDEYGYFRLEIPKDENASDLKVSKFGYSDTLIAPIASKSNFVNIELKTNEIPDEIPVLVSPKEEKREEEFEDIKLPEWLVNDDLLANARNISDTIFSKTQFSAAPYLSTNRFLSGNTVNDFSFNMTVGYVQGVKKFEVAGISNIVREDAGLCQLAGISNTVGGITNGVQAAGIINTTKVLNGIQAAGIVNIVKNDATPCQLAGIANIVGRKMIGLQSAGIVNICSELEGVQSAGTVNLSENVYGLQVAGIANHATTIKGVQIAGFVNNADSIDGIQIAGYLNRARYMKGTQIAFANFADTCDGVPIGFLSIVSKGYHKLELSANEIFHANIAFRTGVKKLHNIITAGIKPKNFGSPLWTFGYGLGTSFTLSKNSMLDIDFTLHQIMKGSYLTEINTIGELSLGLDLAMSKKTSMFIGVSYNTYVTDIQSAYYEGIFSSIAPYTIQNETATGDVNINIKSWVGGKVGIRFF